MKEKTKLFTLIVGLLLVSTLASCNSKNECQTSNEDSQSEGSTSEQQSESSEDEYISGYVDGYSEGHEEGYSEGYEDGYSDGQDDGHEEGYSDGYEDGLEDAKTDYRTIHTADQLAYLNKEDYKTVQDGVDGQSEKSRPLPLEFSMQESPLFETSDIVSSKLRISEDSNFANYVEVDGDDCHFEVYNLKINTKYYYYYFGEDTHGVTYYSDVKTVFVKNEAPRLLKIEGVTNARDDGGWKIKGEDKYTKQGLIYRMGQLHQSTTTYITEEGIKEFKALGIKTEIDLRLTTQNSVYESAVDGVTYYNYPMNENVNTFFTDSNNRESIKNVLTLMANKNNYPLMFHCTIGTDRTGFISFLINALAGVEAEYLYRDYLMSNFANIGGSRDYQAIDNYIKTLKGSYDGITDLSDGAKNYMLDIGLTENEINNIKDIMLGNINI